MLIPDLHSLYIYAHVCLAHDYERLQKPKKGDIIFDVGAHVGFFIMECMRYKPSIIVGIEPHPLNTLFLKYNTVINSKNCGCHVINLAVGEKEQKSRLYLSKYSGRHSLKHRNYEAKYIEVNVTTIDNIVNDLKLAPDYIKIDVEGYEVEVLKGAKKLWKNVNQ
jgi:FkbM family methyltransferase